MKAIYTLILCTVITISYARQSQSGGKINYQETIQMEMDFKTDDPRMAEIQGMLPSSHTNEMQLKFNETSSIYTNIKQDKPEQNELPDENGMVFQIDFQQPENIIFFNFSNQEAVQQRSFMGRTFLIKGQSEKRWKITDEKKDILGYQCRKAILDDSTEVVAWYTAAIPAFTGPETYNGLPGLILEVTQDKRTIVATAIELGFNEAITPPEKGKKVTVKQFNKIMAQKFEEMKDAYGGQNGNVLIIRSDQ